MTAESALADALDAIRQRGALIWGADQEGGGPYVYGAPDDPNRLIGFEVELAELLAAKLGVRAQFSQGQWDKLPDLLDRGDIDIVLNGYEWSPLWAERFGTSVPYYIYELQLLGALGDNTLVTLDDLVRKPGEKRRVAALVGSAAHEYLRTRFGDQIEIVPFDGVTDAMRAAELGVDGIGATLQDLPIVTFFEAGFPGLKRVGGPVGRGYYVVLTRKADERLRQAINEGLIAAIRDGSLRKILERYRLWNETQQWRALETDVHGNFLGGGRDTGAGVPAADEQTYAPVRGWRVVRQCAPLLLPAAGMTVLLSITAMPLAVLVGLSIAVLRLYGPRWLSRLAASYVEIVRGTPLVLQLYVIFFLLPELGINVAAFWAAVLGLALNYSAYEAEIYRAGLQAIPRGQMEAALALGMSRWLALRRIVIPQATRLVIPPVTNDFIALFKDTAVCSVITVLELSKGYYIHARSTGAVVELGIVTALLYLAMSYPLAVLTNTMERRLRGTEHHA